jgi:hypothetical protein
MLYPPLYFLSPSRGSTLLVLLESTFSDPFPICPSLPNPNALLTQATKIRCHIHIYPSGVVTSTFELMASFSNQVVASLAMKLVLPIIGGSSSEPANKKQKKEAQRRV